MILDLSILTAFILITLLIGFYHRNKANSLEDFSIARKNYTLPILVSLIVTARLGSDTLFSISERVYNYGIIYVGIGIAIAFESLIIAHVIAPRIARFSEAKSVSEVIDNMYGKTWRNITNICIILMSVLIFTTQIDYIGYFVNKIYDIPHYMGVISFVLILASYTAYGGIKSIASTSVFRFIIIIIIIPVICNFVLGQIDGYERLFSLIPESHSQIEDSHFSIMHNIDILLIFLFPFLSPPEIQRLLIAKNAKQSSSAWKMVALVEVLLYFIVTLIAISGVILQVESGNNMVISHIIENYLPNGLRGLAAICMLAIFMSAADAFLNSASIATNDLMQSCFKKQSDSKSLKNLRIISLAIGVLSIIVACNINIYEIITNYPHEWLNAYGLIWTSFILIPLLMGIFGIKISKNKLIFTITTGILFAIAWIILGIDKLTGVRPIMPSLIIELIIFIGFYLFETRKISLSNIVKLFIYPIKITINFATKLSLDQLARVSEKRVEYFGAQYVLFGVFAVANYVIPYFLWSYNSRSDHYETTILLRTLAGIFCSMLIVKDYWPRFLQKYLPLYWHFTVLYYLPFMTTFMVLDNNASVTWLLNMALSLFLLSMLVDWLSFLIILPLGFILGYLFYIYIGGNANIEIDSGTFYISLYLYFFSILIGGVFSRNKDYVQKEIVRVKQQANLILEKSVIDRTKHLEEALSTKTDFLNNVSHEVRTPIQGVTAISSGLVDHWGIISEERRYEYVQEIAKNSHRLYSLVNELLDFSKFQAGKMEMHMQLSNILDITKEVIEEADSFYNFNKKNNIILYAKSTIPEFYFDPERIKQVLRNLIFNALKFTDKGLIEINLKHIAEEDGTHFISCSIKDEGIGIPHNELDKIFEPFIQSSLTNKKSGGTGLGLSISKEIILSHKGQIWAENNPHKGAKFIFNLPVVLSIETHLNIDKQDVVGEKIDNTSITAKKINLVIIDDELSCLNSVEILLFNTEFSVTKIDNGTDGLEYTLNNYDNIDVIMLDFMMPDINGIEILSILKNNHNTNKIPIILQTGATHNQEIQEALSSGAAGYIEKPYDKHKILSILRKLTTTNKRNSK
jgi:signal transduction histidine kinase/Na+/proline symporter/ActR/RegA family two-component response regulator